VTLRGCLQSHLEDESNLFNPIFLAQIMLNVLIQLHFPPKFGTKILKSLLSKHFVDTLLRPKQKTLLGPYLLPSEIGGGLILCDSGFKEILFFSKIDCLTHPREGIAHSLILGL